MCIIIGFEEVNVANTSIFARHHHPGHQLLVLDLPDGAVAIDHWFRRSHDNASQSMNVSRSQEILDPHTNLYAFDVNGTLLNQDIWLD